MTTSKSKTWVIPEGSVRPTQVRIQVTLRREELEELNRLIQEGRESRFVTDLDEFNFSSYCRWVFQREIERLREVPADDQLSRRLVAKARDLDARARDLEQEKVALESALRANSSTERPGRAPTARRELLEQRLRQANARRKPSNRANPSPDRQ